jgi:FixJ family two-component response regulator
MATRQKITVIDDEPSVLKATERLLHAKGFEVETFASAEAFLTCGARRPTTCLVLDIKLGGMSGIELRRRLRASNPNLPVIFITGIDREATRKEAMEAGCVAYLQKPFLSHALIEAIERATGSSEDPTK